MTEPALAEAPGQTVNLDEARRYCEHAMKKIRDIASAKGVVDRSYAEQKGEIEVWHTQESERLDGEIARLQLAMRPMVEALVKADPLGKKSVELVAGRAGFREGRERVIVEDVDVAINWLLEKGWEDSVRTTHAIDIPTVKHQFPTPDIVPGLRVEKGERTFFVEPVGVK